MEWKSIVCAVVFLLAYVAGENSAVSRIQGKGCQCSGEHTHDHQSDHKNPNGSTPTGSQKQ